MSLNRVAVGEQERASHEILAAELKRLQAEAADQPAAEQADDKEEQKEAPAEAQDEPAGPGSGPNQ